MRQVSNTSSPYVFMYVQQLVICHSAEKFGVMSLSNVLLLTLTLNAVDVKTFSKKRSSSSSTKESSVESMKMHE